MHVVTLSAPDDFIQWRSSARHLLSVPVPPDQIQWSVAGASMADLFATEAPLPARTDAAMPIPRALLEEIRLALLHSDPGRFALAYRLLWRLRSQPSLHRDPSDADMIALASLAKAVRRDMHKMHAFVRFRKTGEADGREQFAAWFEPDHHIGRAVAAFFRDRFTGMDWLIVTPDVSIGWDGASLREGPGGRRSDVPDGDAIEAEWRAYYASIFNPARVKIAAMKKEMPVRYWRNLPEAMLIAPLIQGAQQRVDAMVKDAPRPADTASPQQAIGRRFKDLNQLYAALEREDRPPSPAFSHHLVMGEGPASARIMIVGEQPGDQEDRQRRPFVGPAGQLLDHCLAEAGIDRANIYLTNAVKRFKFTPQGKRRLHETPNTGDITHYRWWLAEEIRLVAPTVILSLGATALQALTGRKQPLAPLRGEALPWEDRCLFVTIHPSFLLRLPDEQGRQIERARFIRDLGKAHELA